MTDDEEADSRAFQSTQDALVQLELAVRENNPNARIYAWYSFARDDLDATIEKIMRLEEQEAPTNKQVEALRSLSVALGADDIKYHFWVKFT